MQWLRRGRWPRFFRAPAALCIALLCGAATAQEVIPDFYQEPGLQNNRDYIGQHHAEHIDPFTGGLKLSHVDVHVPGNGGLDIEVVRSYNSTAVDPVNPSAYGAGGGTLAGLGWTVHFGRVLKRTTLAGDLCANVNALSVADNPTLELPDGSRQLLAWAPGAGPTSSPMALTTSRWRADCAAASVGGMVVFSPAGLRYDMTQQVQVGAGQASVFAWYTRRITDRNGNFIDVNYAAAGSPEITSLVASDGRRVDFSYSDSGLLTRRIASISANGARTTYAYTAAPGVSGVFQLASVSRPDNTAWGYAYNGNLGSAAGSYLMREVTHPQGGVVGYAYDFASFDFQAPAWRSHVVKTKTADGGIWSFAYTPSTGAGVNDRTTVTTPTGTVTYTHVGANSVTNGSMWRVGLLLQKQESGRTETLTWGKQKISSETYLRPGQFITRVDPGETNAPLLQGRSISLDGATYASTFGNFDAQGNPQTVTESGPNGGSRSTTLGWYVNTSKWIVHQPKDQVVSGGVSVTRSFDGNGNLLSLTQDGVTTSHTHDTAGNVATTTFPRGLLHSYGSYKRGIAQTESQPEGVSITRVVSDAGNLVSQTDGEGRTTGHAYDGLNRVTGITPPRGSAVTIAYGRASKTATRGGLTESVLYDGFGRATSVTLGGIVRSYRYDALGRMTFASNPGSTGVGTGYAYDALDRLVRITNADGTAQAISYGAGSKTVTDERGKATTYTYRFYGDPAAGHLMAVAAPEPGANVAIVRNGKDLVTQLSQGGVLRNYDYNANGHLVMATHPETGTTTYGRDAAGNMTSKVVGASPAINYGYDGQNRLSSVSYAAGTPSVNKTYTRAHRLKSVTSSAASKSFNYDENDNLTGETLTVDGIVFFTGYAYNGLDQLSSITYPRSGRTVSYAPDTLGRPTQVSGFVNAVSYWPSGQVNQLTYGNGTVTTYDQNSRLWPRSFETHKPATAPYLNATYGYDGAGNVTSISDAADASYNRSLGYDNINRLTSASGPWGSGSITYSGSGNITSQAFGSAVLGYAYDAQNRLGSVSGTRNATYAYDALGNIVSGGGRTYTYDAAPNLTCIDCANAGTKVQYGYDGLNQRVWVSRGGVKTYEVYGAGGKLLLEYTPSPALRQVEHVYLGHRPVGRVQSQPSATTLAALPTQAAVNQAVTLTATVSGSSPTGSVTFNDGPGSLGTVALANGLASKQVQFPAPGSHTLTAQYGGDANNDVSTSAPLVVDVGRTTTTLVSSGASVTLIQPFTLTVGIAGNNPTGTVSFMDGSALLGFATLAGGSASKVITLSTPGLHAITAQYAGDALNMGSTSAAVTVQVSSVASTVTALTASAPRVDTGVNLTFTATVTGLSPSGSVTFSDGAALLGSAPLVSGVATFTTSFATDGARTITASYGGNVNNAPSAGSTAISVTVPASKWLPPVLDLLLD